MKKPIEQVTLPFTTPTAVECQCCAVRGEPPQSTGSCSADTDYRRPEYGLVMPHLHLPWTFMFSKCKVTSFILTEFVTNYFENAAPRWIHTVSCYADVLQNSTTYVTTWTGQIVSHFPRHGLLWMQQAAGSLRFSFIPERVRYCSSLYPKRKPQRISKGNQKQVTCDVFGSSVRVPFRKGDSALAACWNLHKYIAGHSLVDAGMKQPAVWTKGWRLAKVSLRSAFGCNPKSEVRVLIQRFTTQPNADPWSSTAPEGLLWAAPGLYCKPLDGYINVPAESCNTCISGVIPEQTHLYAEKPRLPHLPSACTAKSPLLNPSPHHTSNGRPF